MGNSLSSCFTAGSRRGNRIVPTNYSTVLALGLYRRHKKRDEAEHGSHVTSGHSSKTRRKSSKQENLDGSTSNQESGPDQEMETWISSIITQNNLLPSYKTFDNQRHLTMRSRYADFIPVLKNCSVIQETQEEVDTDSCLGPSREVDRLKKTKANTITKHLSDKTFNLGLEPTPKLSTRISKDAVKRNIQKDNELRFHGCKSPPPPKSLVDRSRAGMDKRNTTAGKTLKIPESKDLAKSQTGSKHFHVSCKWLDEDFEESILSFPNETPNVKDIPQCLPPKRDQENHGAKDRSPVKFKVEPDTSDLAVHNLGLFLSAVEEDKTNPKARSRLSGVFKRKNSTQAVYATEDLSLCDDQDNSS